MKALKLVAALVLAASASCLGASPAQAQSPSFDLIAMDGAAFVAKGVALSVKVTYVCAGDLDFADGYVNAHQRVQGAQMAHENGASPRL